MDNLTISVARIQETGEVKGTVQDYSCTAISEVASEQKLSLSYSLSLVEDKVLLRGEIKGTLMLECSRCLDRFEYPVGLNVLQVYPPATETIDVEEEVRQVIILGLPGKPLCGENCAGLCQQCGKNLNKGACSCSEKPSDPRWKKLKDIMK